MLNKLKNIKFANKEVYPIIEGGKGIGVSNGLTSGSFAACNAVGTFSGVNADYYDENGNIVPAVYKGKNRLERHEELVHNAIKGGIAQAKIAHDVAGGQGIISMNILWEMGGSERVLTGILEGTKGLISCVTCGAGMPYRLAEIVQAHDVFYCPIISSVRAFRALWKRAYAKFSSHLTAVVYEDPWVAGGHNGISNAEDVTVPEDPYSRVSEIRSFMNSVGLQAVPIIIAGGVWYLRDWKEWMDNEEIGPIGFQYGTRPILTKESPVGEKWRDRLLCLQKGEVALNHFSPTGLYSSALINNFLKEIQGRNDRQVKYSEVKNVTCDMPIPIGARKRDVYISSQDEEKVDNWYSAGYTEAMKTPDSTLIFVRPEDMQGILRDQADCNGCLSACRFSNWMDFDSYTTGRKPDPRTYCIQKTLQNAIHNPDVDDHLAFLGHIAYKFSEDPFYSSGKLPTIKELVARILTGD